MLNGQLAGWHPIYRDHSDTLHLLLFISAVQICRCLVSFTLKDFFFFGTKTAIQIPCFSVEISRQGQDYKLVVELGETMSAGCLFPVKTIQQTSQKRQLFRAIAGLYVTGTKRILLKHINGGVVRPAYLKSSLISSLSAATPTATAKMEEEQVHHQYIVVMRHGDRLDNVDPLWITQSERPWDPPLHQEGKTRAFATGQRLCKNLGAPIHRVFVSPFLRCLQTASEAVRALCSVADPNFVDLSKIKVSTLSPICVPPYFCGNCYNASILKYECFSC